MAKLLNDKMSLQTHTLVIPTATFACVIKLREQNNYQLQLLQK